VAPEKYISKFVENTEDVACIESLGELVGPIDGIIELLTVWCNKNDFSEFPLFRKVERSKILKSISKEVSIGVGISAHKEHKQVVVLLLSEHQIAPIDPSDGILHFEGDKTIEVNDTRTGRVVRNDVPLKKAPQSKSWMSNICRCFRKSRVEVISKKGGKHAQIHREFQPKY
jgi:hypothetical protein